MYFFMVVPFRPAANFNLRERERTKFHRTKLLLNPGDFSVWSLFALKASIISYHIISCHVISYHIISYHIIIISYHYHHYYMKTMLIYGI